MGTPGIARSLFLFFARVFLFDVAIGVPVRGATGAAAAALDRLVGKIISRFEQRGYKLTALKLKQADEALLKTHYK